MAPHDSTLVSAARIMSSNLRRLSGSRLSRKSLSGAHAWVSVTCSSLTASSERLISTNSSVTRSSETTQYNVTNPRRIVLGTITIRKPMRN